MHKVIQTGDGSHSLYVEELNEHYHSVHGAIQESKHVFIEAGLKHVSNKKLSILEVGLGTGLNALLTILENQRLQLTISYTGLEAFPVPPDMLSQLNYVDLLVNAVHKKEKMQFFFDTIHSSEWENKVQLTEKFVLNKLNCKLQEVVFKDHFDLIYFDAFGPTAQPEMWTEDIFLKLWDALNVNGMLVTYCAKGNVKRSLKKIGFIVETLQGPPGKREMIRAQKPSG